MSLLARSFDQHEPRADIDTAVINPMFVQKEQDVWGVITVKSEVERGPRHPVDIDQRAGEPELTLQVFFLVISPKSQKASCRRFHHRGRSGDSIHPS